MQTQTHWKSPEEIILFGHPRTLDLTMRTLSDRTASGDDSSLRTLATQGPLSLGTTVFFVPEEASGKPSGTEDGWRGSALVVRVTVGLLTSPRQQPASPGHVPSAGQPRAHPACARGPGVHATSWGDHSPALPGGLPKVGGVSRGLWSHTHPVCPPPRFTCKSAWAVCLYSWAEPGLRILKPPPPPRCLER